jgi:hypothetical protein
MIITNFLIWYAFNVAHKKVFLCRGRLGLCGGCQEGREVGAIKDIGHYDTSKSLGSGPWRACEWVEDGYNITLVSGDLVKIGPGCRPDIFTKCIKEVSQFDRSE